MKDECGYSSFSIHPSSFALRALRLRRQSCAGAFGERGERGGVAHGEIGEHLAVERVAGGFQSGDELRIRKAVLARGGVDAGDPEFAEITFAIFAAGVGGVERLLDRLLRNAMAARLHPVEAFGPLPD